MKKSNTWCFPLPPTLLTKYIANGDCLVAVVTYLVCTMSVGMNILNDVLQNYAPSHWTSRRSSDFSDKRYIRRTIYPGSTAYQDATDDISQHFSIKKVEVIENPFLYGRFLLRKEQRSKAGSGVFVKKMYHPIKEGDIPMALEHNCDTRFYHNPNYMQFTEKRSRFYANSTSCSSFFSDLANKIFIVVSCLTDHRYASDVQPDCDTDYYPMFIVFVY